MPIFTPRGLKIRLDPIYAFTLLARLEPAVPPVEVLRTTEAVENAPSLANTVAAAIAIAFAVSPSAIFWASFTASVIVGTMMRYGTFVIPGLIPLARVYSRFSGWGLFFVAIAIFAWTTLGWRAAGVYAAAHIVAGTVNWFF
jgi:hypothetical protein